MNTYLLSTGSSTTDFWEWHEDNMRVFKSGGIKAVMSKEKPKTVPSKNGNFFATPPATTLQLSGAIEKVKALAVPIQRFFKGYLPFPQSTEKSFDMISALPPEISLMIFRYLGYYSLKACRKIEPWSILAKECLKKLKKEMQAALLKKVTVIGKKEWERIYGPVDEIEPPIPKETLRDMRSMGHKIDTFTLLLIPRMVCGKPNILNSFMEIAVGSGTTPAGQAKTPLGCYSEIIKKTFGNDSYSQSHWILIKNQPLKHTYRCNHEVKLREAHWRTFKAAPILAVVIHACMRHQLFSEKIHSFPDLVNTAEIFHRSSTKYSPIEVGFVDGKLYVDLNDYDFDHEHGLMVYKVPNT